MADAKTMSRVETWVWVLIYGGLLILILGLVVEDAQFALGWAMVTGGAATAIAGVVLIYLRSRMKPDTPT